LLLAAAQIAGTEDTEITEGEIKYQQRRFSVMRELTQEKSVWVNVR
jgi:hypothetical protein